MSKCWKASKIANSKEVIKKMQYYAREVPKATLGLYDEIDDDDSDDTKQTGYNLDHTIRNDMKNRVSM